MSYSKQIGIHIAILTGTIWLFEWSNLDLIVQDHFYLWDLHRWIVDRHEPVLRFIFYTGPKMALITIGILCILTILLSYKEQRYRGYRRSALLLGLSLILVPLCISGLKKITNVYTPDKTIRYGGSIPYIKVLDKYPDTFHSVKRGRGWPAGHASGGFALTMLYFVFSQKQNRILGLLTGLTAGWMMGLYQIMNGQHYLSHTIISMQISWLLILIIYQFVPGWTRQTDYSISKKWNSQSMGYV